MTAPAPWPRLVYDDHAPTVDHLHRLLQIGGKYTLDQPFEHNWGHIVLAVTPRGFATPMLRAGDVPFVVDYEILDDRVSLIASSGRASLPLAPGTVAGFYERFVEAAGPLGVAPLRMTVAPEIPDAAPLDPDREERPEDAAAARTVWAAFARAAAALTAWQAPYRRHRPRVGLMWGGLGLVGSTPGDVVTRLIRRFEADFPKVELEIRHLNWAQQTLALHRLAVDAAVVRLPVADASLELEPIARERRVAVLERHHPLAAARSIGIDELTPYPVLEPRGVAVPVLDWWIATPRPGGGTVTLGPRSTRSTRRWSTWPWGTASTSRLRRSPITPPVRAWRSSRSTTSSPAPWPSPGAARPAPPDRGTPRHPR